MSFVNLLLAFFSSCITVIFANPTYKEHYFLFSFKTQEIVWCFERIPDYQIIILNNI